MHLVSISQLSGRTCTNSLKKILEGNEPSQLKVNTSEMKEREYQIDLIQNVLPSFENFNQDIHKPRNVFVSNTESRQLERVNLLESLIQQKYRKIPNNTQFDHPCMIVEVGELYTRAIAFGFVEDTYRLIAIGESISTTYAPHFDIWIGVNEAVKQLTKISGYVFSLDGVEQKTSQSEYKSINNSVPVLVSTGPDINVFILYTSSPSKGEYIRKLLNPIPCNILFEESTNNFESIIECINEIEIARPDLIICEKDGGHERKSGSGCPEWVNLIRKSFDSDQIPKMLFIQTEPGSDATEQNITKDLKDTKGENPHITTKCEYLNQEKSYLAEIVNNIRLDKIRGENPRNKFSDYPIVHRLEASSRVFQFLNKERGGNIGIMGVHLDYSNTSITTSQSGEIQTNYYPEFGIPSRPQNYHNNLSPEDVLYWMNVEIEKTYIEEYLSNKWLFPFNIPTTDVELEIEYAIACQILFSIVAKYSAGQESIKKESSRNRQSYEIIFASGNIFSLSQDSVRDALVLLNGIQPVGVFSMLLDRMDLIPAMGAVAGIDPLIAVQVMESNVFTNLGTFICIESQAKAGTPVLNVNIKYGSGNTENYEIIKGEFVNFPVSEGEITELILQPLHKCNIGMGPGKGGKIRVHGGCLGIVIDGRGRPVPLPSNRLERMEKIRQWERNLRQFHQ